MRVVWANSCPDSAIASRTSRTASGERSHKTFRISNSCPVGCFDFFRAMIFYFYRDKCSPHHNLEGCKNFLL